MRPCNSVRMNCFGKDRMAASVQALLMQILARGICVLWLQWTNSHELPSPVEEGRAWPLSQGENIQTLALTGFYCFSGHITLRMVLIYYAQVHFGWLSFTENKGEDVANYIKKEGYLRKGKSG